MSGGRAKLAVVPDAPAPPPAPAEEPKDIYAEARAAALDSDRWRRLHERSGRAPAITLVDRVRRLVARGGGTRRERGGFKFEERP
jgi:hypothetical protein